MKFVKFHLIFWFPTSNLCLVINLITESATSPEVKSYSIQLQVEFVFETIEKRKNHMYIETGEKRVAGDTPYCRLFMSVMICILSICKRDHSSGIS